ncbi:MAG TPA: hypothetical protein VGO59_04110 [Verrucomicrobiae bacterium]
MEKDEATSSREAIDRAQSILDEENFTASEGYWGGGKCDWYVMGGRWSGELSGLSIKGDFHDEVLKLVRSKDGSREDFGWVSVSDRKKYADEIQKLWLALGGKNANPYARNSHKLDGSDDDAVILSAELIGALKKKWPDDTEYYDSEAFEEKNLTALSTEDIGHWLVAVDCHN